MMLLLSFNLSRHRFAMRPSEVPPCIGPSLSDRPGRSESVPFLRRAPAASMLILASKSFPGFERCRRRPAVVTPLRKKLQNNCSTQARQGSSTFPPATCTSTAACRCASTASPRAAGWSRRSCRSAIRSAAPERPARQASDFTIETLLSRTPGRRAQIKAREHHDPLRARRWTDGPRNHNCAYGCNLSRLRTC